MDRRFSLQFCRQSLQIWGNCLDKTSKRISSKFYQDPLIGLLGKKLLRLEDMLEKYELCVFPIKVLFSVNSIK